MNILDFGAKRGAFCGDAIQRAIDAAAVQGGGRLVPSHDFDHTADIGGNLLGPRHRALRGQERHHLPDGPCRPAHPAHQR